MDDCFVIILRIGEKFHDPAIESYSVIHLIIVMLWIFAFEIFDREFPLDLNNLMQNARISF